MQKQFIRNNPVLYKYIKTEAQPYKKQSSKTTMLERSAN